MSTLMTFILSYPSFVEMKMIIGVLTAFLVFAQINSYNPHNNPRRRYCHHFHLADEDAGGLVSYVRLHSTER